MSLNLWNNQTDKKVLQANKTSKAKSSSEDKKLSEKTGKKRRRSSKKGRKRRKRSQKKKIKVKAKPWSQVLILPQRRKLAKHKASWTSPRLLTRIVIKQIIIPPIIPNSSRQKPSYNLDNLYIDDCKSRG